MSSNELAFFIGLFGSIHCIGMCGPLAFAIPVTGNNWWLIITDRLLYNSGRVITYSLLGLLAGFAGRQLWLFGLQQIICITSGTLILLVSGSRIFKIQLPGNHFSAKLFYPVNKLLSWALQHHSGHLMVGLINGLLPCGLVYAALIGAVGMLSPLRGMEYMFWFGTGTFPLMLLATISSGFITRPLRNKLNTAIPYLMVVLGLWFVIRGLDLNIPYLSPQNPAKGISICK
jgi:hypothetical protein